MGDQFRAFITSWAWEPSVYVPLLIAVGLYATGYWKLRHRGRGRSCPPAWRVWCFALGILTVGLALLSPLDVYSDLFFFMHMTEHMLLIVFAAPLLLLGAPLLPMLWALPKSARREIGLLFSNSSVLHPLFHFLTGVGPAIVIYVVVLAVWHFPPLYDKAQGETATHYFEHLSFMAAALLYWWPVIHPTGGRRRLSYLMGIPYFIPAVVEGSLIGIILTFSGHPVYQTYIHAPRIWGLSVMTDQQIGGLIMWIIGGALYLIPIMALLQLYLIKGDTVIQKKQAPEIIGGNHEHGTG